MEEKKFRHHLHSSKDCKMKLIEKFYLERNDESTLLQVKSQYFDKHSNLSSKVKHLSLKVNPLKSKVTTYPCQECEKPFRGKCPYIHHKVQIILFVF